MSHHPDMHGARTGQTRQPSAAMQVLSMRSSMIAGGNDAASDDALQEGDLMTVTALVLENVRGCEKHQTRDLNHELRRLIVAACYLEREIDKRIRAGHAA